MSRIELAVEKVRSLDDNQVEALLDWLELRQDPEQLRQTLDTEIEKGLSDLKAGRKIPGEEVYREIRERSSKLRQHG